MHSVPITYFEDGEQDNDERIARFDVDGNNGILLDPAAPLARARTQEPRHSVRTLVDFGVTSATVAVPKSVLERSLVRRDGLLEVAM